MKKTIAMMMVAALALLGCTKEPAPVQEDGVVQALKFNLTVTHPGGTDTKAVKTTWDDGDVVFVFFSGVAAPKYLEMKYDAGNKSWVQTPKDGTEEASFALDGDSGTMTAVYLPFGSGASVVADGASFKFEKTYYTYYFVAEKAAYEVADGVVTGDLAMELPEGFVQFFMEEDSIDEYTYKLGIDAVIPVGVASVAADGTVTESSMQAKDDLLGYRYSGGYVFSGKLDDGYAEKYGNNYFFTLDDECSLYNFFVSGKELTSHSAVKLPAYLVDDWQPVGEDVVATLTYEEAGKTYESSWATCNYGCDKPEAVKSYDYNSLKSLTIPEGYRIPEYKDFLFLMDNCLWTQVPVHGKEGMVLTSKSNSSRYFIFLPSYSKSTTEPGTYKWSNAYWGETCSGEYDSGEGTYNYTYYLYFKDESTQRIRSYCDDPYYGDPEQRGWEKLYTHPLRLCWEE